MKEKIFGCTDANFKTEVLGAKGPVLIDFWAVWCGPCKAISPTIEELAKELEGKVKIGKLNVDENPEVTNKLEIFNIPTLMFFKDGQEKGRMVGINSKAEIVKRIKELI